MAELSVNKTPFHIHRWLPGLLLTAFNRHRRRVAGQSAVAGWRGIRRADAGHHYRHRAG